MLAFSLSKSRYPTGDTNSLVCGEIYIRFRKVRIISLNKVRATEKKKTWVNIPKGFSLKVHIRNCYSATYCLILTETSTVPSQADVIFLVPTVKDR